jgi:hypothetical protein
MKHGRTLIAALGQLDAAAGRGDPPLEARPGDESSPLPPLRPGAFAAWAARREAPARRERSAGEMASGVRVPARPPAV